MDISLWIFFALPELFCGLLMEYNLRIALLGSLFYLIIIFNFNYNFYICGIFQTIIFFIFTSIQPWIVLDLLIFILLILYWIHIFRWNYYLKKLPELYPEIFQSNLIRNKKPLSGFDFFIEKSNLANSEKNKIHEIKHKNLVYKFKYI